MAAVDAKGQTLRGNNYMTGFISGALKVGMEEANTIRKEAFDLPVLPPKTTPKVKK